MKICKQCELNLNDKDFSPRQILCKKCRASNARSDRKSYDGLIKEIYYQQKSRRDVEYSLHELTEWIFNQKIKYDNIYEAYKNSNYNKWMKPSIDRLNNNLNYTLSNIQLVTWKDNHDNACKDMKNCILPTGSGYLKVSSYSMDGYFIKTYSSASEAARDNNADVTSVLRVCNGKAKQNNNIVYRHGCSTDDINKTIIQKNRKVAQLDKNNNIIKIFDSLKDIEQQKVSHASSVRKNIRGLSKHSHGFQWKYLDTIKDRNNI